MHEHVNRTLEMLHSGAFLLRKHPRQGQQVLIISRMLRRKPLLGRISVPREISNKDSVLAKLGLL